MTAGDFFCDFCHRACLVVCDACVSVFLDLPLDSLSLPVMKRSLCRDLVVDQRLLQSLLVLVGDWLVRLIRLRSSVYLDWWIWLRDFWLVTPHAAIRPLSLIVDLHYFDFSVEMMLVCFVMNLHWNHDSFEVGYPAERVDYAALVVPLEPFWWSTWWLFYEAIWRWVEELLNLPRGRRSVVDLHRVRRGRVV